MINLIFIVGHIDEFQVDNIPSSTFKGYKHINRFRPMYGMHPSNTPFTMKNLLEELWGNRKHGSYYFQTTSSIPILDTIRLLHLAQSVKDDGVYPSATKVEESVLATFIVKNVNYAVWHVGVHGVITDISTLDRHSDNRLVCIWGELLNYFDSVVCLRNELWLTLENDDDASTW